MSENRLVPTRPNVTTVCALLALGLAVTALSLAPGASAFAPCGVYKASPEYEIDVNSRCDAQCTVLVFHRGYDGDCIPDP